MGKLRALLRDHWPLVTVIALGLVVRIMVAIAYRPALFFSDSWSYVSLAYGGGHFAPDRPSGYPFVLALIGLPGRSLFVITALQHLAGIATGLLSYLLLMRAGAGRHVASVVAGLVILNAYAIVLEQTILAETFFTLAVVGSFFLVTGSRRSMPAIAIAGVLLAGAVTMRTGGVFAVPVWLAYVLYRDRLRVLVGLAAVVLPLLAYAAVYESKTGKFGLSTSDGWFLYGRVGEIADCKAFDPPAGTRDLCEPASRAGGRGPLYYIWDKTSPANLRFERGISTPGSSEVLKRFAVAVIKARPGAYAEIVARDTGRYFLPGEGSPGRSDKAIHLPERPRTGQTFLNKPIRDRYFPSFEPEVHAPSGATRAYEAVARVPRPLLAVCVLLALLLIPLALRAPPGERPGHLPEALALTLTGVAMLFGQAATSGFIVRYFVPTVPLILCGGALALCDVVAWRRRARGRAPREQLAAAAA